MPARLKIISPPPSTAKKRNFISVATASQISGISRRQLRRFIDSKELQVISLGYNKMFILGPSFDQFMQGRSANGR